MSGRKLLSFPSAALVFAFVSLASSPHLGPLKQPCDSGVDTEDCLRTWQLAPSLSSLTVSCVPGSNMDCTQTRSGSWCQGRFYPPGNWQTREEG